MITYNEIICRSLIDFEEIKFVLANNNIELVNSNQVKERYFLKNDISFKNASYKKILENSFILSDINDKKYLSYKSFNEYTKSISKIEVVNEDECIDFLTHIGYKEAFVLEKNVYQYSDTIHTLNIINLINIGLYLSVAKEDASSDELKEILSSFNIPYDDQDLNVSIEKLVMSKDRRYLR